MRERTDIPCTAFRGDRILAAGPMLEVALAVKRASQRSNQHTILVFEDETGRAVDFDLRGERADIAARLNRQPDGETRGRGRPKLGVIAREVTLLPHHWEWLSAQPGGASVTLRKLVEAARRKGDGKQLRRKAQDAAYAFITAMAGNRPHYEEAIRALYADDRPRFERCMADWPADVRRHAVALAYAARGEAR